MIYRTKKSQRKIDKQINQISVKRDLGVKKYGIGSDFFREYLETYEKTTFIPITEMISIMDDFFDKWNIETRHKKLTRIINKIC